MKECDILGRMKKHSDPSYIFSGVRTPLTPMIYAPGYEKINKTE